MNKNSLDKISGPESRFGLNAKKLSSELVLGMSVLTAVEAMQVAIEEARNGVGFVSPNPLVGCVVLDKDGRIISKGFHSAVGQAHAEVDAINKVPEAFRARLEGAKVFVTLEPCSHFGRTPPCAEMLSQLPVQMIVYGLVDPNPKVAGHGAALLKNKGIECLSWRELCEKQGLSPLDRDAIELELEDLAEIFLTNMRSQKPFLSIKVATSLDGQMALKNGESQWITGEKARMHSHYLRAHYDAVLIGRNTLTQDNPHLNVRLPEFASHVNSVVILDSAATSLTTLPGSNLLKVRPAEKVIVLVNSENWRMAHQEFEKLKGTPAENIKLLPVRCETPQSVMRPSDIVHTLWLADLKSVFIEGGAQTFAAFLRERAVQRLHLYMAFSVLGAGGGINWTQALQIEHLPERIDLDQFSADWIGRDLYITGRLPDAPSA